jgi:hypothetical protein
MASSRSTATPSSIRFTDEEKAHVTAEALSRGMSFGEYVRYKVLGTDPLPTSAYAALEDGIQNVQSALLASLEGNIDQARAMLQGQKGATSGNHRTKQAKP